MIVTRNRLLLRFNWDLVCAPLLFLDTMKEHQHENTQWSRIASRYPFQYISKIVLILIIYIVISHLVSICVVPRRICFLSNGIIFFVDIRTGQSSQLSARAQSATRKKINCFSLPFLRSCHCLSFLQKYS
jgi:hypothetical protein